MALNGAAVGRSRRIPGRNPRRQGGVPERTPVRRVRRQGREEGWRQELPPLLERTTEGRCRVATTEVEFYGLQTVWRELSAQVSSLSPFRSWDFAREWFKSFVRGRFGGATGRFYVYVALNDEGRTIGLLPMFEERIPMGNGNLGTTLQPFGRSNSFDTMTDEPIVLLRNGFEEAALHQLKAAVSASVRPSGWDIAVLDEFKADRSHVAMPARRSAGMIALEVTRYRPGLMKLRLPSTWKQFQGGLSKSMRDNVLYYPRRLTRECGTWTLRIARLPADVAKATEILIALHRQRSRSRIGIPHVSHIPTDVHASFMRRWFQALSRRDQMSIVTIELSGEVIAAQAFIETETSGSVAVYYSGYLDRWYRCSPLTVITSAAIQNAISRKFQCFDFPPLDNPWKSRWGATEDTAIAQTFVYSLGLGSLVRGATRRLAGVRLLRQLRH